MANGFQDYWVTGSRLRVQRKPVGGVEQPWVDLGTIEVASPSLTLEKIELEDSESGLKSIVDERTIKIDESYDITCNNLNLDNLAMLFLAGTPSDFTQAAAEASTTQYAHPGRLLKIITAAGDHELGLDGIAGIIDGAGLGSVTVVAITAITKATKTIKATGDITSQISAGEAIIVRRTGLANIKNSRTYTVVSDTLNVGSTDIEVEETPDSDEVAITGSMAYKAGADTGTILKQGTVTGTDWQPYDPEAGYVKFNPGASIFTTAKDLFIVYNRQAVSGKRIINPQDLAGEIRGVAELFWNRGNFADRTVREMEVSITPNAANFQIDDYSNIVLTVKVLSDRTKTPPAGRIVQFKGTLPTSS